MGKIDLGDIILLFHSTSEDYVLEILNMGKLLPSIKTGNKILGGSSDWIYLSPYCKSEIPNYMFIKDKRHESKVGLVLCPSILNDRSDWYANIAWVYGKNSKSKTKQNFGDMIKMFNRGRQTCSNSELLFPDQIDIDKYLIAILTYDHDQYNDFQRRAPEKYKQKVVFITDFHDGVKDVLEL